MEPDGRSQYKLRVFLTRTSSQALDGLRHNNHITLNEKIRRYQLSNIVIYIGKKQI